MRKRLIFQCDCFARFAVVHRHLADDYESSSHRKAEVRNRELRTGSRTPRDHMLVSLWGQRVGIIVPVGSRGETYAFQYDRKFLKSGLEIAPLMMPLRREPYAFADLPRSEYEGLPPAFADSLPDAFGRGLVDRWLTEKGCVRSEITALDRLAYCDTRGEGGAGFERINNEEPRFWRLRA